MCILAGAGTGKTTTITRRIAQQVASGAFDPAQIMAVTFTDKAGGELRARLAALGVTRVRAGTFHSAALRQLRHFAPDELGRILPSKALLLRQIGNRLRAPFKFRPAGDLATEIEWAKNRRIGPERYLDAAERPRAADPRRPDGARLRRLRAAQGGRRAARLRGPARARGAAVRERRARGGDVPRAVPRVHRRRVPGRQPAPADAARALARRRRRPLRRRRRLPVDLRLHRRRARASARRAGALPARDRRAARGELPLDAAGARAREPTRAEARRGGEGAAPDAPRRRRARRRRVRVAGRRGGARSSRRSARRTCRSRRSRSSAARTRA